VAADQLVLLAAAIFAVALLYSSVGHAGASGYIAVMTLVGLAPATIKPTALALNIVVASIASVQFWRAGHFSWKLFWPFALMSVPFAFLGGYLSLPTQALKILLGVVLLLSALRLFLRPPQEADVHEPPLAPSLAAGGGLGLLAGLTGTGGGIFLTPLLLFMHWARAKQAAAVSALFILLNSISGLLGNISSTGKMPGFAWILAAVAALGGLIGSQLGSRRFDPALIKRCLAVVLVVAGAKLLFA
jgi:uncharacterized membrane protein YfcA